jgi:lysylphosphatidylglycerol synthetase-like protein (DUF2156 family)
MATQQSDHVMVNPNRHRAESKATRVVVMVLLLVSAALIAVVAIGGASALSPGLQLFTFAGIALFLVMTYYVFKWSRGVLAMSAALAVLIAVLAIVASTGWFSRDQAGFTEPLVPAAVLGLVCIVLVPVLLLLVAFAMRGFNQAWNIEVAVPPEEANENLADKFDEGGRRIEHEDDDEEDQG